MAWSGAMKKVAGYIQAVVEERLVQERKGLNPTAIHVRLLSLHDIVSSDK
jgi:hypothetical protein